MIDLLKEAHDSAIEILDEEQMKELFREIEEDEEFGSKKQG